MCVCANTQGMWHILSLTSQPSWKPQCTTENAWAREGFNTQKVSLSLFLIFSFSAEEKQKAGVLSGTESPVTPQAPLLTESASRIRAGLGGCAQREGRGVPLLGNGAAELGVCLFMNICHKSEEII